LKIILTGAKGSGKSTLVRELLRRSAWPAVGFFTEKVSAQNRIVGYKIHEIGGRSRTFAHIAFKTQVRFEQFGVKPAVFDTFGIELLTRCAATGKPFLIDEMGVMEQSAGRFCDYATEILNRSTCWLVVVQQRALDFWRPRLAPPQVLTVTTANHDALLQTISAKIEN